MSDDADRTIQKIRDIQDIVGRLKSKRSEVENFNIAKYQDAGASLWAGQKRKKFTEQFGTASSSHNQISEQIGQAIGDCKSKQRSLAGTINAFEHPILSGEAWATALQW